MYVCMYVSCLGQNDFRDAAQAAEQEQEAEAGIGPEFGAGRVISSTVRLPSLVVCPGGGSV